MSSRSLFVATDDAFRSHPIAKLLGIRLLGVTRKRVDAEMPITESHLNRGGRVAGGVIMAFADLLGARGTVANLPQGARTTTIESKTNFFAPGEGPALKAIARPLHIGRTTMVWQTTIRNPDGRLVAVVTQTQIVLPAVRREAQDAANESVRSNGGDGARRPARKTSAAGRSDNSSTRRRSPMRESSRGRATAASEEAAAPAARRRPGAGPRR